MSTAADAIILFSEETAMEVKWIVGDCIWLIHSPLSTLQSCRDPSNDAVTIVVESEENAIDATVEKSDNSNALATLNLPQPDIVAVYVYSDNL